MKGPEATTLSISYLCNPFILTFNEFIHFSTHPQPTKYRRLFDYVWVGQKVRSGFQAFSYRKT